jgi:hypothetical protein
MLRTKNESGPGRWVRNALMLALGLGCGQLWACGGDENEGMGPTNTGQSCSTAEQCYPGVKDGALLGEAVCLDRVEGGYCTHHCSQDSDCCAAAGECAGNHAEVCGPFESTGELYCFLSCEAEDFSGTTIDDADVYCQTYAGPAFHCRSTGGGSSNRKVCVP